MISTKGKERRVGGLGVRGMGFAILNRMIRVGGEQRCKVRELAKWMSG